MLRSRALWPICIFLLWGIDGPVSAQTPVGPTFEVASVKPNTSGPRALQRAGFQPGERVTLTNVTLRIMIQMAYPAVSDIVGGPNWIGRAGPSDDADRFDVHAKAEAPASREQLQAMLRALLADRFKLAAHTEARTEPIWALVVARRDGKLGPHLRRATTDCAALRQAAQPSEKDPCGTLSMAMALVTGTMKVRGLPLDQLGRLSRDAGRRVVDKTGLSGPFDWDLTWTPQVFLQGSFDRERFPTIDPEGPSIFTALPEQLGLKLESQKGEGTVLVMDHVEHPTEN
jgi:uncharacterized protein (TIGR03435 family)